MVKKSCSIDATYKKYKAYVKDLWLIAQIIAVASLIWLMWRLLEFREWVDKARRTK